MSSTAYRFRAASVNTARWSPASPHRRVAAPCHPTCRPVVSGADSASAGGNESSVTQHWYKEAVIYCCRRRPVRRLRRRRHRRLPRPDRPARLPLSARRHLPVAEPDPPDAGARRRLRRHRLLHRRSAPRHPRRLRRTAARGAATVASAYSSTWLSITPRTSTRGSWTRAAAPESKYRDWYVWSDTEPSDRYEGIVFPGEQTETWTYNRTAQAWYYHRFYDFQPDLNIKNPAVRAEILKIMGFWLQLGVAGFRIDAAPFVIEMTEPGNPDSPKDFPFLTELRAVRLLAARRRGPAGRGERAAGPARAVLRRRRRLRQPAAHAVRLHAQRRDGAGAGPASPPNRWWWR